MVTRDGIPITSAAPPGLQIDRVAALTQHVVREMKEACAQDGLEGFERVILTADAGRIILVELTVAYLVVITRVDVDSDQVMLEVDSTARRIDRASRIGV